MCKSVINDLGKILDYIFKQQIKSENKPKSSKQSGDLGSGLKSKEIKKLIKESKK